MSDFKLEVGMFVRIEENRIDVVTKTSNEKIDMYNFNCQVRTQIHVFDIKHHNYEVSYTYDFKEIIYSNIKKELLTEEEKEIVLKWVDVVGRKEVTNVKFFKDCAGIHFRINKGIDYCVSINYKDKFNNVEYDKDYTLEELGL